MKKTFLMFALFLGVAVSTHAQDTHKTLVKTLDPQGTSVIDLNFKNSGIDAQPWDEGTIRIELEITANFPEAVVNQLVKAGRYTLTSKIVEGALVVSAVNLDKTVTVGDTDLDDQVKVFAKTPGYYAVEDGKIKKHLDADAVAGVLDRAGSTQEAKTIIQKMSVIKEKVEVTYRFVYKESEDKVKSEDKINHGIAPAVKQPKSAAQKKTTAKTPTSKMPSIKQTQELYGEILINGDPLDFEYDDNADGIPD